jgi:hypothetical protein
LSVAQVFFIGQVETPSTLYSGQLPSAAVSGGTTPIQPY